MHGNPNKKHKPYNNENSLGLSVKHSPSLCGHTRLSSLGIFFASRNEEARLHGVSAFLLSRGLLYDSNPQTQMRYIIQMVKSEIHFCFFRAG
jgi:hypothetical protein